DLELLKRLVAISRTTGPETEEAKALLESLLAQGKCVGTLHFLLGMHALDQKKMDEAKLHLNQAYQLSPNLPAVANNLAGVLAHADPPELTRALGIINSVLEKHPSDLNFRETRGQIYVKLEKWKEALEDLEAALPAFPKDRNLHQSLAKTYQQLGIPTMAAQH